MERGFLSSPEELIDEARNGRMFILVDDEDRENEGDLVIPAQMATPDAINFMAKHGRGLICLALTKQRVDQLGLELMSRNNGTRHETAFTTSIEAKRGRHHRHFGRRPGSDRLGGDRRLEGARGHRAPPATSSRSSPSDGGVLIRAGHTEAAVDVARLAGLNPSGVICEIMREDGTMARMDDLVAFAQLHGLKVGTIRDLIAYRLKKDHLVEQTGEASFESRWGGAWTARSFLNKALGTEQVALVKGRIDPSKPTLVRMHQLSLFADAFGEEGGRGGLLRGAMKIIGEEGSGRDRRPQPGDAGRPVGRAQPARRARPRPGARTSCRDYGGGAQILSALGVHDMVLLTNTHHTPVALGGYGLVIVGERPITPEE